MQKRDNEMKVIDEIVENPNNPIKVSEMNEKGKAILISSAKEIFWSIYRLDSDLDEFLEILTSKSEIPNDVVDTMKTQMESDVKELKEAKDLTDDQFYAEIDKRVEKLVDLIIQNFQEIIPNFFQK